MQTHDVMKEGSGPPVTQLQRQLLRLGRRWSARVGQSHASCITSLEAWTKHA